MERIWKLEQARPEDREDIYRLYREAAAYGKVNGSSDWDEEYPGLDYVDSDMEKQGLYVLRDRGSIAAAATLLDSADSDGFPVPWTPGKSCVLARLCVSPALQGRGVGAQVERLVSALARERGHTHMRLLAAKANQAALRLYEKLGYRCAGDVVAYSIPFFCMEKEL